MSKQASAPVKMMNYPDVLGAITGGQRYTLGGLQVAVATRPDTVNAGKPLDAIILLQNTIGVEIDAVVHLIIPDKDHEGKPKRFSTKLLRPIRIGLRPGEVGYANLPFQVTHQVAPGEGYVAEVEVQAEQKGRGQATRVRDANGGTHFEITDVEEERGPVFASIQGLNYSVETSGAARPGLMGGKATLRAPFTVLPAAVAGLPTELRPSYVSLWTDADYKDEDWLTSKAKPLTDRLKPQLKRQVVFFPLLQATQHYFETAGFRLWAGEAVMIAKLLTLVLEMGAPITIGGQEHPIQPRWFLKLCQALIRQPALASADHIGRLVGETLYPELIHDAAELGFTMLGTVTSEQFGSSDKLDMYVESLVDAVRTPGAALGFNRVYLPLVLAGLVSNTRISMPQEKVVDTVQLLVSALEKRAAEKDDQNQFIFDMAEDLIQRAIEHF
jgi:hypothetical protein